jgi:hypothetical protein
MRPRFRFKVQRCATVVASYGPASRQAPTNDRDGYRAGELTNFEMPPRLADLSGTDLAPSNP